MYLHYPLTVWEPKNTFCRNICCTLSFLTHCYWNTLYQSHCLGMITACNTGQPAMMEMSNALVWPLTMCCVCACDCCIWSEEPKSQRVFSVVTSSASPLKTQHSLFVCLCVSLCVFLFSSHTQTVTHTPCRIQLVLAAGLASTCNKSLRL